MVADVVQPVGSPARARIGPVTRPRRVRRRIPIENPDHALHDIVDIGEVAPHLAVVEHVDRLAREDRLGEEEQRHVGPPPGSIDGEEPQPGARESVKVRVGMRHELIGFLGRRVERDRMVDVLVHRKGHAGVAPIDRAR